MKKKEVTLLSSQKTDPVLLEIAAALAKRGYAVQQVEPNTEGVVLRTQPNLTFKWNRVHDFGVRGSGGLLEPDSYKTSFNIPAIHESDAKRN